MEVKAYSDKDTRRFHRFLIDEEEIKGTIFFVRDGEGIPDKVTKSLGTSYQENRGLIERFWDKSGLYFLKKPSKMARKWHT